MRLGDGNVLGFFKSGLDADAHGLITIAVSTIFLFVCFFPATHAGMEEYILDLFMVIYMELNECEEEKTALIGEDFMGDSGFL